MTAKIAKGLYSFVMVLYFACLSLLALGDFLYPDRAMLFSGDQIESCLCFSYEEENEGGKIMAFGILPVKNVSVSYLEQKSVVCGGELFGLRMDTGGLLVTGLEHIPSEEGNVSPGEAAGLQKGDLLLRANGMELKSAASFSKILAKNGASKLRLDLKRGEEAVTCFLTPVREKEGETWRAGLWVRDGAAGIGTLTFIDPETGLFGGLGHAVCDRETGLPFPLSSGTICRAEIERVLKGSKEEPGEIRGTLSGDRIGLLLANTPCGVYGKMDRPEKNSKEVIPIGLKDTVTKGKATLVSAVSGKKETYDIEIEEIIGKDRETKNFILRITDPRLLELTGGIVQGMSGSPILQNGHLVGACTHVLVGDPARGYGIFIENMLTAMPE